MRESFLLAAILCAAACVPFTEEQIEQREYQRIDRINEFQEYEYDCKEAGGVVDIYMWGGAGYRDGLPARGDHYRCIKTVRV
jgi:hypothetical protein